MYFLIFLLSVIKGYQTGIQCFYIPQTYWIKVYHQEKLFLIGDNGKEESVFSLEASNGHNRIDQKSLVLNSRGKRDVQKLNTRSESSYGDQNLNKAVLESKENNSKIDKQNYEYNYEEFKSEYYGENFLKNTSSNETLYGNEKEASEIHTKMSLNKTYHKRTDNENVPMEYYCSVVLLLRPRVVKCFLYGLSQSNEDITRRSGLVLTVWIILYLLTASYLWCTRGWCFCCCPCAICHPHDVIREAKQFLAQNPPGSAQLYSKCKVFYEASEYERFCYKALESEVFNF